MGLKIRQQEILERDGGLVVAPSGPIRASAAEAFREHIDGLLPNLDALVIDFSNVEYIDSSTAGYLLNVHDRLSNQGGTLALAALPTSVQVVIDSIGLTTFFSVHETVEDALEELD